MFHWRLRNSRSRDETKPSFIKSEKKMELKWIYKEIFPPVFFFKNDFFIFKVIFGSFLCQKKHFNSSYFSFSFAFSKKDFEDDFHIFNP